MRLTNHERREARGGTSCALATPTSNLIDHKSASFLLGSISNFTSRVSIENPKKIRIPEKSGTPEAVKSKQDHLAGYPFGIASFAFTESATGRGIATPPWIHSLGCV